MLPDRVSNPGPLTYESGALPTALRGPAYSCVEKEYSELLFLTKNNSFLQNRHFPVAMVTEWDKGELSNGFLWFNLS